MNPSKKQILRVVHRHVIRLHEKGIGKPGSKPFFDGPNGRNGGEGPNDRGMSNGKGGPNDGEDPYGSVGPNGGEDPYGRGGPNGGDPYGREGSDGEGLYGEGPNGRGGSNDREGPYGRGGGPFDDGESGSGHGQGNEGPNSNRGQGNDGLDSSGHRSKKRLNRNPDEPPSPSDSLMNAVHKTHQPPPKSNEFHEPLHPTAGINPYFIIIPVVLVLIILAAIYFLSYPTTVPSQLECLPLPDPCSDGERGPII